MFNFYILDLGRKEVGEGTERQKENILMPVRIHAHKSCELGGL